MIRPVTRWATRSPISRSGETTWWAPTRSRMRAWGSLIALAQMFGIPRSARAATVRTLASMPGADAHHRAAELARAELGQRGGIGGVGLHGLGQRPAVALHQLAGSVSTPEHLVAEVDEAGGQGGTEATRGRRSAPGRGCRCRPRGGDRPGGDGEDFVSQPTIGLSWGSRYRRLCSRSTSAANSVMGPTRPTNISTTSTTWAGTPSSPVMPVESPTVEKAEITSNSADERLTSAHHDDGEGGRRDHRSDGQQHERDGLALGEGRDPSAEGVHVGLAPHLGPHHEAEEAEGRDLDAAGGGRRTTADEHEHVGDEQGPLPHLRRSRGC